MRTKATLLGYAVDLVDMEGALCMAEGFLASGTAHRIITLNPEMMILSRRNPDLRRAMTGADAYLPETAGVAWALGIEKVPGIDFMYKLLELAAAKGYSVYFLGARKGVAEKAAERAQALFEGLKVAGVRHGYFSTDEEARIVEEINANDPDLLLVAMGTVPQETFIKRHEDRLRARIVMGVGGSFDVLSGSLARAPEAFRKYDMEWLYRLITQPRRFWRMASTLPLFVLLVWRDKLMKGGPERETSDESKQENSA